MDNMSTCARLDALFGRYSEPASPGCAVAVIQDGEIVCSRGYGLASLEHGVPITPSTVFNIGSMSKQFTAFAVALLEAEGKLALDDDIREYLPEMHDFGAPVAIRHLVFHTSGLRCTFPELLALAEWRDTDATTTQDVLWLLTRQRELNFLPGEEYAYSNSNYILLARICERVAGQSFGAICRERLFDPLGMNRTVVNDSLYRLIPGRAQGYYEDEGGWLCAPLTDSVVGPTNVYTTVEDLAKWDENFYSGQVGGRAVTGRVVRPGRLNDGSELDYAFGLMVGPSHRYRGWQTVEHGGGQGGYGSWMTRFPDLHLSVAVLFNHFLWDMQNYVLRVADLFLEDRAPRGSSIEVPAPSGLTAGSVELSEEQMRGMVGTYFSRRRGVAREVTYADGRLRLQGYDLAHLSGGHFCFEVEPSTLVEFAWEENGAVTALKTITASETNVYERVETVSPGPEALTQYVGRYYSPELDVYWTLEVESDHLIARRRKYVSSRLTPIFRDAFTDDWEPLMGYPTMYVVEFERDERGGVSGLRVSGSRVRRVEFVRVAG